MSEEWRGTLLHLASSVAVLVVLLAVIAARGGATQSLLGLRRPRARQMLLWLALFALLVSVEELASRALGIPNPQPWGGRYSGWLLALRIVGIVLFAPLAEELVFRGVLFSRIATTRLGAAGAIAIPAAIFALLHVQYPALEMLLILFDGLFFGVARYSTGSVLVPIVLHSVGNGYAVYQRLFG
jgi:membrane protease YdiL (CAAX protease family)